MTIERKYPAGEIVYLRSGSPPMTVSDMQDVADVVRVEWFVGGDVRRDAFGAACIWSQNELEAATAANAARLQKTQRQSEVENWLVTKGWMS